MSYPGCASIFNQNNFCHFRWQWQIILGRNIGTLILYWLFAPPVWMRLWYTDALANHSVCTCTVTVTNFSGSFNLFLIGWLPPTCLCCCSIPSWLGSWGKVRCGFNCKRIQLVTNTGGRTFSISTISGQRVYKKRCFFFFVLINCVLTLDRKFTDIWKSNHEFFPFVLIQSF